MHSLFLVVSMFLNLYVLNQAPATSSVSEMYKKIIGKEISAKIILTQGNKNGDSNIYEAVELFDKTVNDSSSGDK